MDVWDIEQHMMKLRNQHSLYFTSEWTPGLADLTQHWFLSQFGDPLRHEKQTYLQVFPLFYQTYDSQSAQVHFQSLTPLPTCVWDLLSFTFNQLQLNHAEQDAECSDVLCCLLYIWQQSLENSCHKTLSMTFCFVLIFPPSFALSVDSGDFFLYILNVFPVNSSLPPLLRSVTL